MLCTYDDLRWSISLCSTYSPNCHYGSLSGTAGVLSRLETPDITVLRVTIIWLVRIGLTFPAGVAVGAQRWCARPVSRPTAAVRRAHGGPGERAAYSVHWSTTYRTWLAQDTTLSHPYSAGQCSGDEGIYSLNQTLLTFWQLQCSLRWCWLNSHNQVQYLFGTIFVSRKIFFSGIDCALCILRLWVEAEIREQSVPNWIIHNDELARGCDCSGYLLPGVRIRVRCGVGSDPAAAANCTTAALQPPIW